MILADLYEENSDLKGDAMFFNSLGTLLSAAQTSNHLLPFLNTFKQNYVAACKAIKERIQQEKEKNNSNYDTNVDDTNLDRLDEQENGKNDSNDDTVRMQMM